MAITAEMVKELRERTGAGMMDCKKALVDAGGDMEKAAVILRERGLAAAAKKASRIASEGLVESYIHLGGRVGVLIEVNCETDFVAKTDEFKQLVRDLAMQVAASKPMCVRREEVPADAIEQEREIYRQQALNEGKPEKVIDKIVDGRLEKFYQQVCLLEQPFIKDQDKTVGDLVTEKVAKLGENISVRRFARFELGEGLEKRVHNLAAEVAAQLNA
jgi:elongation factor Ts